MVSHFATAPSRLLLTWRGLATGGSQLLQESIVLLDTTARSTAVLSVLTDRMDSSATEGASDARHRVRCLRALALAIGIASLVRAAMGTRRAYHQFVVAVAGGLAEQHYRWPANVSSVFTVALFSSVWL